MTMVANRNFYPANTEYRKIQKSHYSKDASHPLIVLSWCVSFDTYSLKLLFKTM